MTTIQMPLSGSTNSILNAPVGKNLANANRTLNPSDGSLAYDETTQLVYYGKNLIWNSLSSGGGGGGTPIPPSQSRVVYVTKYGDDSTGDGSSLKPFLTISKAVSIANTLSTSSNPINIQISPGMYVENNSGGPIIVTADGVSIIGTSNLSVTMLPSTPSQNLLVLNKTARISDVSFQSSAPLATALILNDGALSGFKNLRFVNFSVGVSCLGTINSSYAFTKCGFVANLTAVTVNNIIIEFNSCDIFGRNNIALSPVNTGISASGSGASVIFNSGLIALCATGMVISNNARCAASACIFRRNQTDFLQTTSSNVTLSACDFQLTGGASFVCFDSSDPGTITDIIACSFDARNLLGIGGQGVCVSCKNEANVLISGGTMDYFDKAIVLGNVSDTSTTIANIFSLIVNDCNTDILQQGTSTLNVNSCSLSSTKITINDSVNVTLAYFDLSANNSLYIGSDADVDTSLLHAALGGSNHIGFHYQPNIYGSQSISSINTTANPSTLLTVCENDSSIQSVTSNRTNISKLSLYSDTGVQVGTTTALRGWDIQKNGASAELDFSYVNTDSIGQTLVAKHTVFELDGLNNLVSLPTAGSKLVFGGDTNLYRSSSNVLKTDDNFIVATLTPGKIVETDPITNELISSVVSSTELSYLSGVTSSIQPQLDGKVSKSGDIMTGTLLLPDGSAATPSLTFSSSTDTGLFENSDNLSVTTNGVERLKIASDGVVSIKGFTIPGVVHNDSFGNLTTSQIVDADISIVANILDSKLAPISTPGKVLNSATTATDSNTPDSIVSRNALGNFSANVITATSFAGNVTGSASLNVLKSGDTMTGGLTLPAGLLMTPSLKFTGSTNTGITAASSNTLSLISNGVEKAKVDSTGFIVPYLSSTGVVHNDASGLLSTSLIVNSDITNSTITNAKLSTISSSDTPGYIVVRDGSGNFSTNQITIDGPIVNPTDVATKSYVDTAISTGLVSKTPAIVVSTSNVALSGLQTIDSVTLVATDRVLLTNQTFAVENGLWEAQAGPWTRPSDFNTGSTAGQAYVLITGGLNNAGSSWLCNTPTAVIDTDPIGFALFSLPDTTTGNNVGVGTGQVFKNKTGVSLNFKTLKSGSHTTVTNNTDDITISIDAVSTNIANTIVSRDGSGNFSAGTITASLTGTASNNVAKSGDSMSGTLNMLTQNEIRFQDLIGGEYVGIKAPSAVPSSYTLALPTSAPVVGQTLKAGNVTATQLEWVTNGGSQLPITNRVIYVTKNGNDITGDGSFDLPYASLNKALQTANVFASVLNPINISVSAGLYIEDNSMGPLSLTSDGIAIVGDSSNTTIFTLNTPTNDFLVINQSCNISNVTFTSPAQLARGLVFTLGINTIIHNLQISNFLTGAEFSGVNSSYLCESCVFINNGLAVYVNDTATEFTSCTFLGNDSIYNPPANTALTVAGANAACVITGGSCLLCTTGLDIQNNSLLTASSLVFKLNTFDVIQKGASHMTLLSCTFAITTSNSDVDIQISESGTYAEIIGCQFNGKDILSVSGGTAIHLFDGARLDINGGDIKNYDLALRVGINTDTSTTQMFATAIGIHECILDLVQEGQAQLKFNTCTSSSSKIVINDTLYVKLAYFDVDDDNTLTIGGNLASQQLNLLKVTETADNPTFSYLTNFYSTRALGYRSTVASTLYSLCDQNDTNITAVTGKRNKSTSINLISDEGVPIGSNTALRGWSITKVPNSSELIFNYQNTNTVGQPLVANFTIFELDGVNNQVVLPNVNTKLYFSNDTNLYRNSANLLQTDGGLIVGSLTPNRVVTTDGSSALTSSVTTSTEIGYLSGVTSAIQTQLNNKVSRSGDTMTGALTLPGGLVTTPSLQFTGSTNTGLSAVSNVLSFSTNSLERMKISSAGTVSINGFTVAGVVHNDALGNLTTSLITNADIVNGAGITDNKLANISTAGKVLNSATTATTSNTPNTIVLRDGSGNFSAGIITADLNGNALTATTATTATSTSGFTEPLAGDVTGTQTATVVSFVGGQSATSVAAATVLSNASTSSNTVSTIVKRDGSGNFSAGTITATFVGNLTGNSTNFTGSLLGDVTGTQSSTVVSFVGGQSATNVASATVSANSATNLNTVSTIVKRDGSGNFSANVITATLSGTATNFSGTLLGDVTGTQSTTVVSFVGGQSAASVAGSVALTSAATNLNTASTIVKRDISGNFSAGVITATLSGTATNFSGSLLGDVTGTQSSTVVSFVGGQTSTDVANATTLALAATNLNTNNAIVKRDGSGNFSAGTITASFVGNLTGNASTATSATNFSGSLLGDVTGTQSSTVVSLVGGQSASNVASATTLALNATNLNTASTIVKRDASGNFTAGTITATFIGNLTGNVTGNATSATNFSGSLLGDVTGNQSATVVSLVGGQSATNVASATTLALSATNLNNINTIVKRDGSGNFSAGTITATFVGNLTGNATSTTNFSGSLSGDVTGTQSATVVSFVGGQSAANVAAATVLANTSTDLNNPNSIVRRDGSGNFSANVITATFVGNLTGNATSTTNFSGSLSGDVTGIQTATVVSLVGGQSATNVATATVLANAATDANTVSTIVKRDATGNFSAGTITASSLVLTTSFTIPAGTAASPSLKFSGSTNTGFSAPTANKLSFDCNGTEMMTVDTANITFNGRAVATTVSADQAILVITANANNGTATALSNTSIMLLKNNVSRTGWTFVFPPSPINGQLFTITLGGSASITFVNTGGTGGASIVNGITTITTTAPCVKYVYYSTDNAWYRIG